jgi:hypothetical protein
MEKSALVDPKAASPPESDGDSPFEEVAIQSKVALQAPDPWLDRCPLAKPASGFAFLVGAGVFLSSPWCDYLGFPAMRLTSKTLVADRHRRPVAGHPLDLLDLLERGFQRMTVVVVFRQAAGSQDHPDVLVHYHRALRAELILFVFLALGHAVDLRCVQRVDFPAIGTLLVQDFLRRFQPARWLFYS